jgi:hypothetical protein
VSGLGINLGFSKIFYLFQKIMKKNHEKLSRKSQGKIHEKSAKFSRKFS